MPDPHKNFAASTVATAPSPATSGTSMVLASGGGALMPAVPFNGTDCPSGQQPTVANAEIVRVTAIAGDTLTIVRAQEGTNARAILVGDQFFASITTKTLTDLEATSASVYNAVAYGADPTGTADSLAAINATIAAMPARGGVLLFPPGIFKVTDTINLDKPIIVQGSGGSADFHNADMAAWLPATEIKWAGPAANNVADGAITAATATLTSATATFAAGDVGKWVIIAGAGYASTPLHTKITAFTNATTVTVGETASTTVSGAAVMYGKAVIQVNTSYASSASRGLPLGGVQIRDLGIDGNATALKGISADRLQGGRLSQLGIRNLYFNTGIGLHLFTQSSIVSIDCHANNVTGLYCDTATNIRCDGSPIEYAPGTGIGIADVHHHVFTRMTGVFWAGGGIELYDCDNLHFSDLHLFRAAGSGYGVVFEKNARGCYILHLDGNAGVLAKTPAMPEGNFILGYEKENGQPSPVLQAGANLDWTETGRAATGWRLIGPMARIGLNKQTPATSLDAAGSIQAHGLISRGGLGTGPTPAVTPNGATGATAWGYRVVARTFVGQEAIASAETQITNGNATLTGVNYNRITFARIPGAFDYAVYRTTAGGTPATTGRIGVVVEDNNAALALNDTGLAGNAVAYPTIDKTYYSIVGSTAAAMPGTFQFTVYADQVGEDCLFKMASVLGQSIMQIDTGFTQWGGWQYYQLGAFAWALGNRGGNAGDCSFYMGPTALLTMCLSAAGKIGVGGVQTPNALLHLAAGAAGANNAALKFTSGVSLTTPEAGAIEFDGTAFFKTIDVTSGRTQDGNTTIFRLTANGSAIGPTIADYFGATSALPTVTNGVYELTYYVFYLKTTAGTVTYTITNTQTYTNLVATYEQAPVGGIGTNAAPTVAAIVTTTAAAATLPVTGSLTTAVNHLAIIKAIAECGTAGNIRLRVTSSAGTVTPLRGSFYTARRLFVGNVGTFAA